VGVKSLTSPRYAPDMHHRKSVFLNPSVVIGPNDTTNLCELLNLKALWNLISAQDMPLCLKYNIKMKWGTAVAQWLRCCATNRKVAGLIPDGITGIFH